MSTRLRRTLVIGLALGLGLGCIALAEARAAPAARGATKPSSSERESPKGVVNINTATPEQLRLLPGIGPTKANAVLAYRAKRKFAATHELIRVRGIGRKTFRKLQPFLTVNGPTTLTERPRTTTKTP